MSPDPAPLPGPIDSVLLIDGDNDPHFPPGYEVGERTLVRVFLRQNAETPRTLTRRLAGIPNCVSVTATKTAGNAADFVMALHAGILHATLPMHIPFTIVTNDKGLSVIAQEFQRVGRQTVLWTSHAENGPAAEAAAPRAASGRGRGRGRGRRSRKAAPAAARPAPPPPAPAAHSPEADALNGQAAAAYAQRLSKTKDPPSRLKSLLRDIASRVKPAGCDPQAVVDLLVGAGIVSIDANGRVTRGPSAPGAG